MPAVINGLLLCFKYSCDLLLILSVSLISLDFRLQTFPTVIYEHLVLFLEHVPWFSGAKILHSLSSFKVIYNSLWYVHIKAGWEINTNLNEILVGFKFGSYMRSLLINLERHLAKKRK